ncbi:hypothetical protein NP233_g2469 [Leucocoprinus birnbaumii]|uniref:DUF6533 domain-containing protein n=1 Tax=Leucocoprinus birnbaumii TaxID=56174 RepID=A0AAD5VY92_9AGAR|nr:hypothetical protein NP233_g2469 [Leucocoprinus birnbaumii]
MAQLSSEPLANQVLITSVGGFNEGPTSKVGTNLVDETARGFSEFPLVIIFTFLACDHVDTIRREIELIWKARWSLAKVLFFVVRYIPYALLILNITFYTLQMTRSGGDTVTYFSSDCVNITRAMVWLGTIGTTSAEGWQILRKSGSSFSDLRIGGSCDWLQNGSQYSSDQWSFKSDPSLTGCVTMLAPGTMRDSLQLYSVIYDASVIYSCTGQRIPDSE